MKIIRPLTITDAVLAATNVPETDYPAYSGATSYALGDRVIVVGPEVHKIYESLQSGNVGHAPATSPTYWEDVGPTNRWRPFDRSITSQVEQLSTVSYSLQTTGICNSIALLNMDCTIIRIVATDVDFGVVYDKTINPAAKSGISDIYSYFREEITRVTDLALTDLPSYSNMRIDVTLTNPRNMVRIGGIVVGMAREFGGLQYGAKVGISDYGVKTRDRFGSFDVAEGAFSSRATFSLWIEAGQVDLVKNLLAKYRATPIVYIGVDGDAYTSTIIYGYYKDFSIDISYVTHSICSLELEGLT